MIAERPGPVLWIAAAGAPAAGLRTTGRREDDRESEINHQSIAGFIAAARPFGPEYPVGGLFELDFQESIERTD